MTRVPLSVLILTHNEELNLAAALESVTWAEQVVVVDSFSTDATTQIAEQFGAELFQNRFAGFPQQRNWALRNVPFRSEWVLILDADEQVTPPLARELRTLFANPAALRPYAGFEVKRRFIWMGRWIRRGGYYPVWLLRLVRHREARCLERSVNEHLVVEGMVGKLSHDLNHDDRRDLGHWIAKHNRYAELEARELAEARKRADSQPMRLWGGSQAERTRWLQHKVWNRMPPLVRPFFLFGYRYVLRGGFLDGWQGLSYHFLQGLWLWFLIDLKYLEATVVRPRETGRVLPPPGSRGQGLPAGAANPGGAATTRPGSS